MKIILNNIVFLTLFFASAFNSFAQSLGDPIYDDNIDSYRLIAVSNDSIESISNTISVENSNCVYNVKCCANKHRWFTNRDGQIKIGDPRKK